jgi:hypothetical protein
MSGPCGTKASWPRLDDAFDVQAVLGRFIQLDVHVAPGIDNHRASGRFVTDQI